MIRNPGNTRAKETPNDISEENSGMEWGQVPWFDDPPPPPPKKQVDGTDAGDV